MPLYEYQCAQCGRFEVIQKFSDPPLAVCPTCGHEVHKLLSAPAIQFKGTGWYITDYARKGASGEGKKGGGGAGTEGGKDAGGTDSGGKGSGESSASGTAATASKKGSDNPA